MAFKATKPVSVWNREVKVDFKGVFRALTKAASHGFAQKWEDLIGDFGELVASLGLGTKPAEFAWLLINRALARAMHELAQEYFKIRGSRVPDTIDEIVNRLDLAIGDMPIEISHDFFLRPRDNPIVSVVSRTFFQWLTLCGLSEPDSTAIVRRFPSYYVLALHEEWQTRAKDYDSITKCIYDGPFSEQVRQELAWLLYNAILARQVEEPVFDAAFGLDQIYVPLRGWQKEEREEQSPNPAVVPFGTKKSVRVVVDAHTCLAGWISSRDRNDRIRVVSGGPGGGKSSLAKMFAREQSETGVRVLFIPLHRFWVTDDLRTAIGQFAKAEALLPINPLDPDKGESDLLLIFDGLDELASQGAAGQQTARDFIDQIYHVINESASHSRNIEAIITGRTVVINELEPKFKRPQADNARYSLFRVKNNRLRR